jgi:hypothetical protein
MRHLLLTLLVIQVLGATPSVAHTAAADDTGPRRALAAPTSGYFQRNDGIQYHGGEVMTVRASAHFDFVASFLRLHPR